MPSCHAFELVANIVLMQKIKDLKARNWYMIQSLNDSFMGIFASTSGMLFKL